jgi:beta-glucosidase-like glycosyl hydrolase/CubicO group peptidase (beta-lactamase class C family)
MAVLAILVSLASAAFSEAPDKKWAEGILESLTLREKIAQLVQIRVPGKFINRRSPEFQAIREQVSQNHIGGIVLFAGNIYESAVLLNELQTISKLPLLVAADFERGASFRIADTTSFPWAMALGATGSEPFAYQQGLITARESRALGVHWIFAPVLDVNNNPDNPVINIRSFGEDPGLVARLGSAFIRGAKKGGVLTTAKHFPGHGDTAVDSHIGLPAVDSDMARLQSVEFAPFRSAIEAGVDSIMTAHVAVPRITGEPELPATLSSKILTDLLRNTLRFRGIVVTDALEMAGITNHYWCGLAAIRAIQAGADVLTLPPDAAVAINEVERAVRRGDITEARIDQSVRKVLDAKRSLGLQRNRLVSVDRISQIVASPQNLKWAQDIADHSITAVKDDQRLLPIHPESDTRVFSVVLASDLESFPGAVFQAEMRRRFPALRTAWVNLRVSEELLATLDAAASESDLIVCSAFARLNSGADANPESPRGILERLAAAHKPLIWIAFGNPYALRPSPRIGTSVCAFSNSDVSQVAAAKALAGEIEITGRMPVSIPEYCKAGDGLQIPKLEMILKSASPEALGLRKNAFEETRRLLTSLVAAAVLPGAQLMVGYQGMIALDLAVGRTGFAANSAKVSSDTVYDLASLSRIVGATSAAMLAAESGSLMPAAPVQDYIPEFKGPNGGNLRVQDLLKAFSRKDGDETEAIDESVHLLQKVVGRAAGLPSDRFLAERLFGPLGMNHTFSSPPENFSGGIARYEALGSAPLFCSAHDAAIFAQMLLNRGVYHHRRCFNPETISRFTQSQGPWSKPSDSDWTGRSLSPSAYGHSSSSGSFLWIDPARKLFIVFLTNGSRSSNEGKKLDEMQGRIGESILSGIMNHE